MGAKQQRDYLLESIIAPNAKIGPGFESVLVTMKNGNKFAGIVKTDNATDLVLNSPEDGLIKLKQAGAAKRERGISPMPEELWKVLPKRDLRDLVEFLANLK